MYGECRPKTQQLLHVNACFLEVRHGERSKGPEQWEACLALRFGVPEAMGVVLPIALTVYVIVALSERARRRSD